MRSNDIQPKAGLSSLRVRLVGVVFVAIAPALIVLFFTQLPWVGFAIGLLALAAAWFGGERFVLRQLRELVAAVRRVGAGDFSARTGLAEEPGEIGELAQSFDNMAGNLEQRVKEREQTEQRSLDRSLQQTAVAALGQFALTSDDLTELWNQTVALIAQMLEVEFCRVLELMPDGKSMLMRAGVGWKKGVIGIAVINADAGSQASYTLTSGEPVVISDLRTERRFTNDPLLEEHRIVSGASVAITARSQTLGVLAVYSGRHRNFNNDDLQFLLAAANSLAMAVEHRRASAEMRKLAEFAQLNPNPALELNASGAITYFNQAALHLAQSISKTHPRDVLPTDITKAVQSCLTTGQSKLNLQSRIGGRVLSWSMHPMTASQVVHCYVTDITDRLNLEGQLRQSQKMESVGQLAAGVAHDFNNMLTVIQGHAGMMLARPTLPPELRESLQAVCFAAERAASLTRQLLLFSRKSVMQPRKLDLREVVANMTKMLKRLLGDAIALEFNPPEQIPLVLGDTAMAEQIVMNLAVNARDAMALGGKLTIEIAPMKLGLADLETHPERRSGNFVCLRISDTGHGMKAATMMRLFEPFFTTKEPGKGTGLGLATVYAIVKQHEGWIEVSSQMGKGTTFAAFFPAMAETATSVTRTDLLAAEVSGGNETILVVEDEAAVLNMGKLILQDCGYQVLEAASSTEALAVWQRHEGSIDMLLTDLVMPVGISGMELAVQLLGRKPSLKIMFSSGYCVDDLDADFRRKNGPMFLQKPYTRHTLATAVRECLDRQATLQAQS
jgi:signal transduction histidine kinase/HAMP domain-containing protein/ActR/RegA family two-component response regulator